MKKLMIVAAAAAMSFVAKSDLKWENCPECAIGSREAVGCDYEVFKVIGSGKAVVLSKKGDYKEIGSLKIKKGALALEGSDECGTGECCYDNGYLFAQIKAGSDKFDVAIPVDVKVWSAFGKKYDDVKGSNWMTLSKKKKNIKLDSVIYVSAAEVVAEGDADTEAGDLAEFTLDASAFGKVEFKINRAETKKSETCCGKVETADGCGYSLVFKTYKGWFVGTYTCVGEDACFTCSCGLDAFGGTWKAKYDKKASGTKDLGSAMSLAEVSFKDEL